MTTRRELLEKHNNDYGFDMHDILSARLGTQLPVVSIVIPYYETGENFSRCFYFLQKAAEKYPGRSEVIVVDDGSVKKPLTNYVSNSKTINAITLESNRGRTEARNIGLSAAKGEIVLFLDSDVLIDENLIINHVKLHIESLRHDMKAICVGFFEFTDARSKKITKGRLKESDIGVNDFRIDCTYGATWIGCEDDKQFIGQRMRLVDETQQFKDWQGQHKAWMLPNMVLGGAFSVVREEINAVRAFDSRFTGYGFTETSAVTKMVAERSNVVIPCLAGGAIHIEDEDTNVPRDKKNEIFKKKHDFYFNVFLEEEI